MAGMKPRHAALLALVITWYLMAPPSMREDSWSCSGGLLATLSHDFFGTGDQNVCDQWAKIADLSTPLSKWHEPYGTAAENGSMKAAHATGDGYGDCAGFGRTRAHIGPLLLRISD
jgi:hypothetical protein